MVLDSVLERFQSPGLGWLPFCGIPHLNSEHAAEMCFRYWVNILYLHLCSLHYCIFCALFLRNAALHRERNKSMILFLSGSAGAQLWAPGADSFCPPFLSLRYIKSTEGVVEASRRLKRSGTVVHGGTLPAGRPSTAIFLGTACQSIPQCPTTPLETNGLKQQQLQTAWILSFLVFLVLFLEKIICIPPPAPHSSRGPFWFLSPDPCGISVLSALPTSTALHGHGRKLFVCLESPVFALLQTENKPFTALA